MRKSCKHLKSAADLELQISMNFSRITRWLRGADYVLVDRPTVHSGVKLASDRLFVLTDCSYVRSIATHRSRAGGFGKAVPTQECGLNGREPSMEFQMRNTTFISSMVLSVACVSAANAAFLSIDDFQTGGSAVGNFSSAATGGQYVDLSGSFGLSGYRQTAGQFWGNQSGGLGTATLNQSSSVVIGSGSMNMSYSGTKTVASTTGTNKAWQNFADGTNYGLAPGNGDTVTRQTAMGGWDVTNGGTAVDWSTLTSLSFDIANFSTSGLSTANTPRLFLSMGYLTDPTDIYTGDYRTFEFTLANGSVSLSQSSMATAGVNLAAMLSVNMYFTNTYTTALGGSTGIGNIPSGSVDISNFGVSGVPAPGAIALLGAAGLIGARRRRA